MKFIAILFGIILLIVIIWLYMQDRIPKEDDNPKIKMLLPSEDAVAREIKKTLNDTITFDELTTGISLKASRQKGKITTSGGLSEIKYKEYSGSVSLNVLGKKAPLGYTVKTSMETDCTNKLIDKFVEESYLYNKFSPFNKQIHEKLKGFNDLPLFSLPLKVKHGLSKKNKMLMLKLPEDEKLEFIKSNLEIIEISTTLQIQNEEVDQKDKSMKAKLADCLAKNMGFEYQDKLTTSSNKKFTLFPIEQI